MAPISLADIVSSLPSEDSSWGPVTTTDSLVDGVPYAPYSKGDKLGRMADWTTEGKDGRDGRGGRQQYNRNYRGKVEENEYVDCAALNKKQTNKFTALEHQVCLQYKLPKTSHLFRL